MALFKIMKGSKDRLSSQATHEGYAWYTTEDGGFYVDAANVDASGQDTGSVIRKRVNDASNTSFTDSSASGAMVSTNVHDAIIEANTNAKNANKSFTYNSETQTLEFS